MAPPTEPTRHRSTPAVAEGHGLPRPPSPAEIKALLPDLARTEGGIPLPFPEDPPPGPFRPSFWRSPIRGTWLTAFLGSMLLVLVIVSFLTGLVSHAAYKPDLGHNFTFPKKDDLPPLIDLPQGAPAWLYAFTQGLHITIGLITVPVILAKLWSVIPKLFAWPPFRSPAQLLERLSVLALVGGGLFELTTGILDIQVWYPWHFSFVTAHYYGGWVFICALALHFFVKLPTVRRAYREQGVLKPLRANLAETVAEPYEPGGLAPASPAAPTISRRGLLAVVGGASAALLVANFGESIGGPLRRISLLAPRGRVFGTGPNAFQVNKTAQFVGVTKAAINPDYALELVGADGHTTHLSRAQLLSMAQHTQELPIACVEGWSTTQHWTGVRLSDLKRLAGIDGDAVLHVFSLQTDGPFRQATYDPGQVDDHRSLLALSVNGAKLSLDHGYPARTILPNVPGVHNTKWIGSMKFYPA
jgi:DMSO/TMAO reductase YedYZ molybdopterin-dependent catalytic subunit